MSQGGFLSLRAALTCTERVRGVVLIGSEAGINTVEEKEGYRQVFDQWQSNGPLGDVGQFVGNLLFGDPALTEKWLPVWEARDRSSLIHPAETLLSRDDITSQLMWLLPSIKRNLSQQLYMTVVGWYGFGVQVTHRI